MKIEVGKRYRTRDGRVATVDSIRDEGEPGGASTAVQVEIEGEIDFCCIDGAYYSGGHEHRKDLVEELPGEQAAEAAAEEVIVDTGTLPEMPVTELSPGPAPCADVQAFAEARAEHAEPGNGYNDREELIGTIRDLGAALRVLLYQVENRNAPAFGFPLEDAARLARVTLERHSP